METAKTVTLVVITPKGIVDVQAFVSANGDPVSAILMAQQEAQSKHEAYGASDFLLWRKQGATVFFAETFFARYEIWIGTSLIV